MDIARITELADELEKMATVERASFGLYREAHEEDVVARATKDGVVLFAAELLHGLARLDNPVGNSIIALDDDAAFRDAKADLHLYAVEVYGDDLAPPRKHRLRIAKKEYVAVLGCLIAFVLATVFAVIGIFFAGRWLWQQLF